ncbi:4Fe-4S binding protein [Archaeoglobus veneficus]|uniref:4Fe-4S ferredoxin iron-sulfur binding domain-containing protein n=1 Tax=Archaeoglobus veneficus (strain DSM 11195 / SNP6) TaxID=693661 RepID=F2KMX4_ARCVS|nr:4Fe-4S binding protein [Archaeoglobus veneficus]AEA47250.1 4Fe-4S ferredoxin iron-sulfur binding domain-containing protein [Archaeoglobus veneficus SNP6]
MIAILGCQGCGMCSGFCDALIFENGKVVRIDYEKCTLCLDCVNLCPHGALIFVD